MMGFFSAWTPKEYGIAQIFTAQGSRKHVDAILPSLLEYLETAGGSLNCSVKEERVARSWVSSSNLPLPPVIGEVIWQSDALASRPNALPTAAPEFHDVERSLSNRCGSS